MAYYEIGKLLSEAGKAYGESIIEKYVDKLVIEVGKKYNKRTLFRIRQFYKTFSNEKVSPLATLLSWSHYVELLSIKDINEINYYIKICEGYNLSRNDLRNKIKNKEYQRLDDINVIIKTYKNVKSINQESTIGIVICKKDNMFLMEYCSDDRVYRTIYECI